MEENLAGLAELYSIPVIRVGSGWDLRLPARSNYACALRIAPGASDWDARVLDPTDGQELWNDWMDYLGYDKTPEVQLIEQKQEDIASFIETWIAATGVRVIRKARTIFWGLRRTTRVDMEWEHGGAWEPIRIWEQLPPNKRMQPPDAPGQRNVR